MKTAILTALTLPLLATWTAQAAENDAKPEGAVNIRDFADRAVDGDWSPAIQAAIDHVTAANGYENGATVFFPPGTYNVCGVCAQVYDEAKGDPERGIPAGTKFETLPDDWTCPACDGAKNRFFEPQP